MKDDIFERRKAFAQDIKAVFSKHFPHEESAAFVISFTLPPDFMECHFIGNVSRDDMVKLMKGTIENLNSKSN